MSVFFTVLGKPQGKARARTFYNKNAGRITSMTPEKTVLYENYIKTCYMQAKNKESWFDKTPLEMEIKAFFEIPKSVTKRDRELMLKGLIYPTKKPDSDNIAKVVCDALNGVAYLDDTQIIKLTITKLFDEKPRLEVKIREID